MYHSAQYRIDNGSSTRGDVQTLSTIQVIKPRMEIKAIGEKTTVNSFVPHDGMTIQTQHKDYKKKVAKDNSGWDAIDNDLDTGFVVKIKPTSQNSKVMINMNAHIGVLDTPNARWWGAKLYRKIGSGTWLEVTEANGDNSPSTVGGSDAGHTGTPVWFSDNNGTNDGTMANSSASYLDSPNTTETIYYTIYWASSLNGTNSRLYLNRVDHQNSAIRPSPMSSITANEIWSSGSPYIPPTDGVISVYNNKIGIDNTTPGYDLDVSGNINFTGSLYQDGVAFSGGAFQSLGSNAYYNTGNVGIGTTNPTAKLHIETPDSPGTTTSVLNFKNTEDYGIYAESDSISGRGNTLDFKSRDYNGNNNNIRNILSLRPEGNVGIGTTNPTAPLFINGAWNNLLSIKGNGSSEKEMRFFSGSNYCAIAVNSSNSH